MALIFAERKIHPINISENLWVQREKYLTEKEPHCFNMKIALRIFSLGKNNLTIVL
jgi:hypothetical protein